MSNLVSRKFSDANSAAGRIGECSGDQRLQDNVNETEDSSDIELSVGIDTSETLVGKGVDDTVQVRTTETLSFLLLF